MDPSTLFIVYTVFASLLTVFVLYKNFRFLLWKKTYGTVVKSKPKRVESIVSYPTYEPDIEYVYTVNGENYKSDKLFIVDFQSFVETEILSLNLQELANILKDWLHKTLE